MSSESTFTAVGGAGGADCGGDSPHCSQQALSSAGQSRGGDWFDVLSRRGQPECYPLLSALTQYSMDRNGGAPPGSAEPDSSQLRALGDEPAGAVPHKAGFIDTLRVDQLRSLQHSHGSRYG
jgi:hypothetical protein